MSNAPDLPSHPEMVSLLAKPGSDIYNSLTSNKCHLLHMVLGIVGEVGEIVEAYQLDSTTEHKIEEFGDIEFYLEGFRQGVGMDTVPFRDYIAPHTNQEDLTSLVVHSASLLDLVKKYVVYNKGELDINMVECDLYGIDAALRGLYFSELVTAEQVKRENIIKLLATRQQRKLK